MVIIKCHLCRGRFRWDIGENGYPTHCLLCRKYIGTDGKDEIVMPFISRSERKTPDRIYREMEQKSELRAQMASEITGQSMAELSHMKTTDMKDNLREGDTTFVPVVNDVSRAMDAAPQHTGFTVNAAQVGLQASQAIRGSVPVQHQATTFIHDVLKPNHGRRYNAPVSDNPSNGVRRP